MGKNSLAEILKSNAQFYHAEGLSIDMTDNLWKHDENVICVHPGWELLIGWLVTGKRLNIIFQNTEVIKFNITNPKVKLFDNGGIGIVVCQENIETSDNGQKEAGSVLSPLIFLKDTQIDGL